MVNYIYFDTQLLSTRASIKTHFMVYTLRHTPQALIQAVLGQQKARFDDQWYVRM